MPYESKDLSFRRVQTDDLSTLTVFHALSGALSDGTPIEGPWESHTVELTTDESAWLASIIARTKSEVVADSVAQAEAADVVFLP